MTVAAKNPIEVYSGDGVTTAFAARWRYIDTASLKVELISSSGAVTAQTLGVHYTATAGTTDAGGTVTMVTPPAVGQRLRIKRVTPRSQPTQYPTSGAFPASSHELALDRTTMTVQELGVDMADVQGRALQVPDGETIAKLPAASSRIGKMFAFDGSGNGLFDIDADKVRQVIGAVFNPVFTQLASLVMFLAAGVGAVTRTVQDKLRDSVTVEDYGAVGDGVADDTAAIQKMIDDRGYFTLSAKTYRITNTLTIPPHSTSLKSIGAKFSGAGMEKSVLRCDGMAGKSAIASAASTGLYRVTMADFSISGDADTCISFALTIGASNLLYQSQFRDLVLTCAASSAFKATSHFSCGWENVHTFSSGGHGFELQGGNSTILNNCYAHTSGAGKAGYRILGGATLIACNGVDAGGDIWGDFGGATAAGDPYQAQFRITMIGCNVEDWDNDAIVLRNTGSLTLETVTFQAKASGTINSIITQPATGAASLWKLVERNSVFLTKGATLAGASRVIMNAGPELIRSNANLFTDVYRADQALLYAIPKDGVSVPAFSIIASKFAALDADRYYGFTQQVPTVWTANATTFSVAGKNVVKTANTGATAFATATGGTEGQELSLVIRDAFTTVNHGTGANAFNLKGAANLVCASGDVLKFVHNGTGWKQI